jgi:hypothetical protein
MGSTQDIELKLRTPHKVMGKRYIKYTELNRQNKDSGK